MTENLERNFIEWIFSDNEHSVADPGRFGLDPEPTFCCDADKKDLIFMVVFGIKFVLSSFLGLG